MNQRNSSPKQRYLLALMQSLFASFNTQRASFESEGFRLNQQRPYCYRGFSFSGIRSVGKLTPEAKQYLDQAYEEIEERLKQKERICAYFVRYMNQCKDIHTLQHLVPKSVWGDLPQCGEIKPFDDALLGRFKTEPEYAEIKALAVFNAMGV